MHHKKRPILLLEFLIALAMLGVISAVLFTWYRDLSVAKSVLKKERQEIFARQKLQLRLGQILSKLKTVEQKHPSSYLLTYDHGGDPDPLFTGVVEGHLHLEAHRLLLTSTSKQGIVRKELLYDNIHSFELKFFSRDQGDWDSKYPKEKPFMIQLILNNSLTIPFFL